MTLPALCWWHVDKTLDEPLICMTLALIIGVGLGVTGKAPTGSLLAWLVTLAGQLTNRGKQKASPKRRKRSRRPAPRRKRK